jgi:phosphoribosylaminoimidazole-succinocarboxamide synthase
MKHRIQSLLDDNTTRIEQSTKREIICERQGKLLYQSDKPDLLIQEFTSSGIGESQELNSTRTLDILRNNISAYLFEYLEGFHIPTHFVAGNSDVEMLIKKTEILPISLKVYNAINGSLMKRFNIKETITSDLPIIEHYYNNGGRTNAWVNEYHIYALSIATPEEFKHINRIASKVNAVLRGLCDRRNLALGDLQLEFGRFKGQITLIDELSPLTCRFLDMSNGNKAKRDKYSIDQEKPEEAFMELSNRLMLKS